MSGQKKDRLHDTGKAMRALRVLSDEPMTEEDVWLKARLDANEYADFHGALRVLVARGYAKSHRHAGRRTTWTITREGRERREIES